MINPCQKDMFMNKKEASRLKEASFLLLPNNLSSIKITKHSFKKALVYETSVQSNFNRTQVNN
jgi:hypothetical protein